MFQHTYVQKHTHIHLYTIHSTTDAHAYMVRRLAFPAPPQWYGLVGFWGGGGGAACAESGLAGGVGCSWAARGHREGWDLHKPYASHKPYNVGRVPVFINFNLYHPSLNPA